MNFSDYQSLPGINASLLKACAKSAYDGFQYLHNPIEPTDAMRFGTALHAYFLERETFDQCFAVSPKFDRRTKEGKSGFEAFTAQHRGKEIIDQEDMDLILALSRSARQFDELEAFFRDPDTEREVTIKSEYDYPAIKGRLDALNRVSGIILDVKTTKNADERSFGRDFISFGYDIQLYHYAKLVGKPGEDWNKILVLACETSTGQSALYNVTEFVCRHEAADRYHQALETAQSVLRMKEAPPKYGTKTKILTIPAWA